MQNKQWWSKQNGTYEQILFVNMIMIGYDMSTWLWSIWYDSQTTQTNDLPSYSLCCSIFRIRPHLKARHYRENHCFLLCTEPETSTSVAFTYTKLPSFIPICILRIFMDGFVNIIFPEYTSCKKLLKNLNTSTKWNKHF